MRKIHKDFIDCIILSTAIITSDAIATFDTTLFNIIEKSPILVKKIQQMNPNFEFWFHDFSEPPKKLIYKK